MAVSKRAIGVLVVAILATMIDGALVGLGGAFMPLAWFGGIVKEILAGRGFIALTCVVFSGLELLLALAAAAIFGFAVAITPGVKKVVPFYFVKMTPYITTIVVVAVAIGRVGFPAAVAKPYSRKQAE